MTRIVNVMIFAAMLALGMASSAYAGKEQFTSDFHTQAPGARDGFIFECSQAGHMCAKVQDAGPFLDNVFGVDITCLDPTFESDSDTANVGGGEAQECVSGCRIADIGVFCSPDSPFCDDDYLATFTCAGQVLALDQYQDE